MEYLFDLGCESCGDQGRILLRDLKRKGILNPTILWIDSGKRQFSILTWQMWGRSLPKENQEVQGDALVIGASPLDRSTEGSTLRGTSANTKEYGDSKHMRANSHGDT